MDFKNKYTLAIASILSVSVLVIGCSSNQNDTKKMSKKSKVMTPLNDGDVAVPNDYRSWPKFVPVIDKAKIGQVREIYINKVGMQTKRGEAFPSGTVSVMELWAAKKNDSGALIRDTNGRLIKSKLSKVFVMEKGEGWGAKQPKGTVDNGDWLYGAYLGDKKTVAAKKFDSCRSCHLPLAEDDYIARYDEHFNHYKK